MNNIVRTLLLTAAIPIAACQTTPPREVDAEVEAKHLAHDRVLCAQYGYSKGAEDFGLCMQALATQRARNASNNNAPTQQHNEGIQAKSHGCDDRDTVVEGDGKAATTDGNKENCGF